MGKGLTNYKNRLTNYNLLVDSWRFAPQKYGKTLMPTVCARLLGFIATPAMPWE
jgi:hypothetical protein